MSLLGQLGEVSSLDVDDEPDRRVVTLDLAPGVDEQFVSKLSDREDVVGVRWKR